MRRPAAKSDEHTSISPLTNKNVQPRKDTAASHHLQNCENSLPFEYFSVLCRENRKYILKLLDLFKIRDRQSMNQKIPSTTLCLLE